jgi:hypothetical protein
MTHPKARNLFLSLVLGAILLIGFESLLNAFSGATRAASVPLFVSAGGGNTGCTQPQPCSLQSGLGQAVHGDTIYFGTGV